MATNHASNRSKLIFAPGENPSDAHSADNNKPQQAGQFQIGTLIRKDLDEDPFVQFHKWFSDPALAGKVPETVTLSTAELPSGRVSSRMVYLKELDDKGFVIYSNWGTSQKAPWFPLWDQGSLAHDIATNPYASLCFWWKPLERQVRVSGPAYRLTSDESQVYYDTRARGSRIGAWASQQSKILSPLHLDPSTSTSTSDPESGSSTEPSINTNTQKNEADQNQDEDDGRAELESQVKQIEARFSGQDHIPVPDFWGGLRVIPDRIEFWQGRDSRLHDRFEYSRDDVESKSWKIVRLSP